MAADSSFDVTSKIDRMELDNAINQAVREIDTRFDFKNLVTTGVADANGDTAFDHETFAPPSLPQMQVVRLGD